ncbi:hypothetical protein Val02_25090 [Virgisporangium aliadipatigenens]|uniref:Translation initiation factor n=1 Tax=Virgisporangium aliadipatigenens TaxID=741659 RepID=A0A8J3YKT4_9ACTN|nr:hypothetical protein [Virgisporangium aliadipatigenens]GIJ45623.1 hypothetical protein Val02_25090 [Virgisporangium aliadipatigenens]
MATAVARGLSTSDLTKIRDTLAAGRKPKVVFTESAGQIVGQVGQVIRLTDPEVSEEWVVVRFGRDELPFAPTDLAMPTKAPPRRADPVPSPRTEAPAGPALAAAYQQGNGAVKAADKSADPVPSVSSEESSVSPSPTKTAPPVSPAPAAVAATKSVPPAAVKAAPAPAAAAAGTPEAEKPKPAARKAAKPKPAPSLTVTVAYTDGEWMVSAQQGSKALAKPYIVKASEALKMVSMLDVPGVQEAVEEIVSAARDEAQRQAERLRAELAEVESRLAELSDAG